MGFRITAGLKLPNVSRKLLSIGKVSTVSCDCVKSSPGCRKGWPYTSSAEEHWRSSFTDALKSNSTTGNSSFHRTELPLAIRDTLTVLWNLSIIPLLCGWYVVVWIWWHAKNFVNSENNIDSNCVPWSCVIVCGIPNLEKFCVKSVFATTWAEIEEIGYASVHLVNLCNVCAQTVLGEFLLFLLELSYVCILLMFGNILPMYVYLYSFLVKSTSNQSSFLKLLFLGEKCCAN